MDEKYQWQLLDEKNNTKYVITKSVTTVGRNPRANICCSSVIVSKQHAQFLLLVDGTLYIQDNGSANGVFINRTRIAANCLQKLNENDEIGIGISGNPEVIERAGVQNYFVFNLKRVKLENIVIIDDSDEETSQTNCEAVTNENVAGCSKVEDIQATDDVIEPKTGDVEDNSRIMKVETPAEEAPATNLEEEKEPEEEAPVTVKVETPSSPPRYEEKDSYIVIDDDDNDIVCSQLFEVDAGREDDKCISDSMFFTIKTELEEMDRVYGELGPVEVDSDSDFDILGQLEEALKEIENQQMTNTTAPDCETPTTLPQSPEQPINTKKFYSKPPIIEPHVQKSKKTEVTKAKKPASKRRSSTTENHANKKLKTGNNFKDARTDTAGIKTELRKRRTGSKDGIDREEKERRNKIRKTKLKEIAQKSPVEENKSPDGAQKVKSNVKVKVSDGRGAFLLDELQVKASGSKKQETPLPQTLVCPPTLTRTGRKKLITIRRESEVKTNNTPPPPPPQKTVSAGEDVMQILNWNTSWLIQQRDYNRCPQVSRDVAVEMPKNFASYEHYCRVVNPLLMMELWNYVCKEFWMQKKNKIPVSLDHEKKNPKLFVDITCQTYITSEQLRKQDYIKEGDLIFMDVRMSVPENGTNRIWLRTLFGYVRSVKMTALKDYHMIISEAEELDEAPHSKIEFNVSTKYFEEKLLTSKITFCKVVTSLVSHVRIFKSVRYLEHSPLCKFILEPSMDDYRIPEVAVTNLVSKDKLNDMQLKTVMEASHVCTRDLPGIYLIQGPPGTGKSTVITNIVQQILWGEDAKKDIRILLTAPSNGAVDHLVLRFIKDIRPNLTESQKKALKLIRVGPKSSIHPDVQCYWIEEIIKKNMKADLLKVSPEANQQYRKLQVEISEVQKETVKLTGRSLQMAKKKLQFLKERQENFCSSFYSYESFGSKYRKCSDNVFCSANIICTTLSSCMGRAIVETFKRTKTKVSCCIVDEATQSCEQETLIPLMLGVEKLVLVGDPRQLYPTTMSMQAKELGYGTSLFKRIEDNFLNTIENPIRMLNFQYRMHPEICSFPNRKYYSGKLRSAPINNQILHNLKPYLVFNITSNSLQQKYQNDLEIRFIHSLIESILSLTEKSLEFSIGIITPYNNQKVAINKMLDKLSITEQVTVSCNTVDGFQGQEKDVIILSCVRSNPNSFLSDERRMNVALTRAKYAMYVVGVHSLFKNCAVLGKLADDAAERKLLLKLNINRVSSAVLSPLISKQCF